LYQIYGDSHKSSIYQNVQTCILNVNSTRIVLNYQLTFCIVKGLHSHTQRAKRQTCIAIRAGLKGRGPEAIFTGGPPWCISWRHLLYNLCFRWFATFSFAFSSSRLCACRINSIVSRLLL